MNREGSSIELQLLKLLASGEGHDKRSVSDLLGCCERTAREGLKRINRIGKAHISCWKRSKTQLLPVYVIGEGANAEKPEPMSGATRQKQLREDRKIGVRRKKEKPAEPALEVFDVMNSWNRRDT